MRTFIEPLYKDINKITFGWNPEPNIVVSSYSVYVGLAPASMVSLITGIRPDRSQQPPTRGKIVYEAPIEDIRSVLGLSVSKDFSNTLFFFAITYVDANGEISNLDDSRKVEVPPVGILGREMKEDPSINRHGYVFSDSAQRWIKMAGSARGGVAVSSSDFYLVNTVTEFKYDSSSRVIQEKTYLTDSSVVGSPAKLKLYEYVGTSTQPSRIIITDSTV